MYVSLHEEQMKKVKMVQLPLLRERNRLPFILRKCEKYLFVVVCCVLTVVLIPRNDIFNVTLRMRHISTMKLTSELQAGDDSGWQKAENGANVQFSAEYNLAQPFRRDFSRGQSKIIDDLLNYKENGFFVDIGAGDGETDSVSLFFERERSWEGVLVEKGEEKCSQVMGKNRRASLWNLNLRFDDTRKHPHSSDSEIHPKELFRLINRSAFDLLIINLHGREFDLIRSIDFSNYNISVISVELQNDNSSSHYTKLTSYLQGQGYTVAHLLIDSHVNKKDVIYSKAWTR